MGVDPAAGPADRKTMNSIATDTKGTPMTDSPLAIDEPLRVILTHDPETLVTGLISTLPLDGGYWLSIIAHRTHVDVKVYAAGANPDTEQDRMRVQIDRPSRGEAATVNWQSIGSRGAAVARACAKAIELGADIAEFLDAQAAGRYCLRPEYDAARADLDRVMDAIDYTTEPNFQYGHVILTLTGATADRFIKDIEG